MALMRTGGGSGQRQQFFLVVIFIAMLIDGVLLAIVHANFIRDHGYDISPLRHAVARPLPP
jgi:hypothetical protein